MLNKTNTKQGESMSMIGVKKRLEEEFDNLLNKYQTYHYKVNGVVKSFDSRVGFDQIGITAETKLTNDGSQLYATYFSLLMLLDIKPDLKERA